MRITRLGLAAMVMWSGTAALFQRAHGETQAPSALTGASIVQVQPAD
jgi:hypothetical protein